MNALPDGDHEMLQLIVFIGLGRLEMIRDYQILRFALGILVRDRFRAVVKRFGAATVPEYKSRGVYVLADNREIFRR